MNTTEGQEIMMLPVQAIRIANPRVRDRKKFEDIVRSIAEQGLKRPITVSESKPGTDGSPVYDLVCGQGRLEAFMSLGQTEIPAIIRKISKTDGLVASLVENIARRRVRAIDQIRMIQWMHEQGNTLDSIARKTGFTEHYLQGILKLLEQGEERVLAAVLLGRLPISIAVQIGGVNDEDAQHLLLEAYERKAMKQVTLDNALPPAIETLYRSTQGISALDMFRGTRDCGDRSLEAINRSMSYWAPDFDTGMQAVVTRHKRKTSFTRALRELQARWSKTHLD